MKYEDLTISDKQCKQIASYIYLDIANYIKEHQEEYKNWCNERRTRNAI